jgi:hypothetical protein
MDALLTARAEPLPTAHPRLPLRDHLEKNAMGWYLDGRVTAVVGTHTHVPTADAGSCRRDRLHQRHRHDWSA